MSDCSLLFVHQPDRQPDYSDLAEWDISVPLSHLLLVGVNPQPCASVGWNRDNYDGKKAIALKGDAQPARLLFEQFLNWLEPQLPPAFVAYKQETLTILNHPQLLGSAYHLEPREVYLLSGFTLKEMVDHTVFYKGYAADLVAEVQRLISTEGATLESTEYLTITDIKKDWFTGLGLDFSAVRFRLNKHEKTVES